MVFLRRSSLSLFDPYVAPHAVAQGHRSRPLIWSVALLSLLGSQFALPCATVYAQTTPMATQGTTTTLNLTDGAPQTVRLGGGPLAPTITKLGTEVPRLKIKPSAATGCGPGGDCDVTMKGLDLSRVPAEKELRMAGQMGGALAPLYPADVSVWEKKFDKQLKDAGISAGLRTPVVPPGANLALSRTPANQAVSKKRDDIKRLKGMNLEFGQAMMEWNQHHYRAAATQLDTYLKKYPDSPWAGEAALHLGCDSKYNGRFNEAQSRYEEILKNTSADPKDQSWEIHQKARLRWADLDIALGRFDSATEKLAALLQTETDWHRKSWERYWMRDIDSRKVDSRVARACGTQALGFVLASVGRKEQAGAMARLTPVRQAGFSLAELSQLAARNGTPMEGFRASTQALASLPLPFIIHYDFGDAKRVAVRKSRGEMWPLASKIGSSGFVTRLPGAKASRLDAAFKDSEQAGHFLVVNSVDAARQRVHLFDPQEGRHYTLSYEQLNREWSGAGLKLASTAVKGASPRLRIGAASETQGGYTRLSMTELRRFVGGCCGIARAPSDMGPAGGTPSPCGSPQWSVNPVSLNLNILDIPLWNSTPVGPDVQITMSYNAQDGLNLNPAFGNKWVFNYGSYLVEDTGDGGGVVTVFMPTGAEHNFLPLPNNGYKPDIPDNLDTLRKVGAHRFVLTQVNGTQFVYDIPAGSGSMQPFLIEQRDKYGYGLKFGYDANVHLTTITDAQNKVTRLWYDGWGHIVRARTPQGREASWEYDVNGNMVKTVDIEGNPFGYVYDREIRLTELVSVQGSWRFKHEGPDGGRQASYPAPDTAMWAAMRLTITNPLDQKQEYFYNGYFDRKYWHVDGRNYTPYQNSNINNASPRVPKTEWQTSSLASGYGKITKVWLPSTDGGQTSQNTTTDYDVMTGWPNAVTDSRGRTTRMEHNAKGQVTSVTDWQNHTSRLEYAPNGLDVTKVIDWRGRTQSEMTYSGLGQVQTLTIPAVAAGAPSQQMTFEYMPWGAPHIITNDSQQSIFNYDGNGNLQSVARNGVTLGTFAYDMQGRLQSTTDSSGQSAGYAYDELDNVRKVSFTDGSSIETASVCCGLPGATKDRAGRWSYNDYDVLKRPTRTQDPAGNTLEMEYDANGNLLRLLDAKGTATYFRYDALNRLIAKRYADNTLVQWIYDEFGRLSARRDDRSKVTRYSYDSNDNLLNIDYPTMPDVSIAYDAKERPSRVTDAIGTTVVRYDEWDRVTAVDGPWANDSLYYDYDVVGRLSATRVEGAGGAMTASSGGDQVNYAYDGLGRFDSVTNVSGVFDYVYGGNDDKLSELRLPNGSKATYGYDSLDRLQIVENKTSAGDLISRYAYSYEGSNGSGSYEKRGVRTALDAQLGSDAVHHVDYAYSIDDQLTGESATSGGAAQWNRTYNYDTMGNRLGTSRWNTGEAQTTTTAYTPNALNQIASLSSNDASGVTQSTLSYDAGGNVSARVATKDGASQGKVSYLYDDLNRLSEVVNLDASDVPVSKSAYVYDASSRRRLTRSFTWNAAASAWNQTGEKRSLYDGMNLVQERDQNNLITASYTWAGSIGGLLSRRTFNSGMPNGTFYYHYDGGVNVTGLSDAGQSVVAKYRYDGFGNTLEASGAQAGANPFRFSTKEVVGGLVDYGFRFYDSGMGRFLNRDPIKESGGLNLYAAMGNDPINMVDEYGLIPWWLTKAGWNKWLTPPKSSCPDDDTTGWDQAENIALRDKFAVKRAGQSWIEGSKLVLSAVPIPGASAAARGLGRGSTVWNSIKATQSVYPGSAIPRSFELSTGSGSFWVHGNATEHFAEYAASQAVNRTPEAVRMATQAQLTSFHSAVEVAARQGVTYGQMMHVNGWELIFQPSRVSGGLPVIIHALLK